MTNSQSKPDLHTLIRLFYSNTDELGAFEEVDAESMSDVARELLAHDGHMTVTVERFHGCQVDVEVIETSQEGTQYSRKILLRRQSDGEVVQFGIVRLHLEYLEQEVCDKILAQQAPLGRVLIEHNVMRKVELSSLWRIEPGTELSGYLGSSDKYLYGRTALIYCNGEPAVELLEIVTPK